MKKTPSTIFDSYISIVAKNNAVVADDYNEIANDILKVVFIQLFTKERTEKFIDQFQESLKSDGIEIGELMEEAGILIEAIGRKVAPQMVVNQSKEDDNLLVGIIIGHTMCNFHDRMRELIKNFHAMAQIMPSQFVSSEMYRFFTKTLEVNNG